MLWKAVLVLSAAALAGGALIKARPAAKPAALAAQAALRYSGGDFMVQKLDHFTPTDLRTWNQRYSSYNNSQTKVDGPTFILLKGQEPIQDGLELYGSFARDLSDQLNGPSFILEHRFYSESPAEGKTDARTTGDMKLENLRYLSVDQALADIAYFITYIRKTGMIGPNSKVVLYGGEYAGSLATWARLKYPHLVHAAVASSAPLRAQLAYTEYMDEVMKKLDKYGGKKCGNVIRDVIDYVEKQSKTAAGQKGLISTFKLCAPFGAKKWDVDMLVNRIATNVAVGLVKQINADETWDNVAATCQELQKPWTIKGKAEKVGQFMMVNPELSCQDVDYDHVLAPARVEQWDAVDETGYVTFERAILYQACFELGSFPTLNTFHGRYPLDLSLQRCKDVFGAAFDKKALDKAVARINEEYGGDAPEVTRVVFVRGGADPNNVRGVRDGLEDMDPIITIADRPACSEMKRETPRMDSDEVIEAHALVKERIVKYLAMND